MIHISMREVLLLESLEELLILLKASRKNWRLRKIFDFLLNYLDGLESIEGVVVFITINHIEKLNPALIQAGRMDRKYQMPLATSHQKKEILLSFYPNSSLAEEFS